MTQSPLSAPALLSLPYQTDSLRYFHTFAAQLPMAVILQSDRQAKPESASSPAPQGRFDIITAAPEFWLETRNGHLAWHGNRPPEWPPGNGTSFSALHRLLDDIQKKPFDFSKCLQAELPFCGGLIGYCSYDLAREYIKLANIANRDIDIPDMQFGFYGWACIQDHLLKKCWLVIHPDCSIKLQGTLQQLLQETEERPSRTIERTNRFTCNMSKQEYTRKFTRIQEYINAGDCYQINFAQRFQTETTLTAQELYYCLRQIMPSPYCALLPVLGSKNSDAIICLSPERFVQLTPDRRVISQPIKGTIARDSDPEKDTAAAKTLQQDPKNRAENVMIVDLLRNDLGKVCKTGSIKTSHLFELQTFSNVHHLVSTIQGKLAESLNGADLLQACFPGGSITGAPKIRAMEIIEEMEPQRRSIYCGSIAVFSAHGAMDSNITIRTVLLKDQQLYCWGGGGIVADSSCESEYSESITKIQKILDALIITDNE